MSHIVMKLKDMYSQSASPSKAQIERVYADNVTFKDTFHSIKGTEALSKYLEDMSKNINFCTFDFIDEIISDEKAFLHWSMDFSHPKLNRGKVITIVGTSKLYFRDKVFYHEDFYDAGALLYEHVPLLGRFNRFIKARIGS